MPGDHSDKGWEGREGEGQLSGKHETVSPYTFLAIIRWYCNYHQPSANEDSDPNACTGPPSLTSPDSVADNVSHHGGINVVVPLGVHVTCK